jgi:hypothetical protein
MLKKYQRIVPENLWNRLSRNLIYDAKQVLLYCGIKIPTKKNALAEYDDVLKLFTRDTHYGIIRDPITNRLHFEPEYIQGIIDQTTRFDFPVYDKSFGPGGIAGYIYESSIPEGDLKNPDLNDILKQAIMANNNDMPFAYLSARQLSQFEVEQFAVMTRIFNGPIFFNVSTKDGVNEAEKHIEDGNYVITIHTILESPLTFTSREKIDIFIDCVSRQIPISLVTQPFSGQNAPMTPYGLALLAFSEFLAAMALAYSINPETKVINGALPTMCTPGIRPHLKLGTVVHNFVNFLVSYTSRLLDLASIQSGCTIEGKLHKPALLETDYETARAIILWENLFEGWHMIRHTYGFLDDMACFSFEKAKADITALRHIQSLDENGIRAIMANNVRLNQDYFRAEEIYQNPTLIFNAEKGGLVDVIIETIENFNGYFGRNEHTLKNVPVEWF